MRFIVRFFAVIGVLAVLMTVALGSLAWWGVGQLRRTGGARPAAIAEHSVLRLVVPGSITDGPGGNPLQRLLDGDRVTLRQLVETLDRAAADSRIGGLFADLSTASPGVATAQELRDAVQRFRAAGKPAVAFAASFAEAGGQSYYLASAFDQVWMQPSGELGPLGFDLEHPFFPALLRLIGVTPRFDQRWEFKGGTDSFYQTGYPAPVRQNLGGLVADLYGQVVHDVAAGRHLAEDRVRGLGDQAPLGAEDARTAGLIDQIGYVDQAVDAARRRVADAAVLVPFARYAAAAPAPSGDAAIGLIYGVGPVVRGGADDGVLSGSGEAFTATATLRAFERAIADRRIGAIVFRINSPGGSYTASDTIWRAVARARTAGKPVVVSMGALAASGGYFAAMGADRIVAEPGTLTGSIGVYGGKFVLTDLWDKLGVSWDRVEAGGHASMESPNRDWTADERQRFGASLDRTYLDFAGRAAADRKLSPQRMDELARGRVWTGRQAAANGLVDAVGGLETAIALARELAKLPTDQPVRLRVLPEPEGTIDRVLRLVDGLEAADGAVALWVRTSRVLLPLMASLETGRLQAPVTAP